MMLELKLSGTRTNKVDERPPSTHDRPLELIRATVSLIGERGLEGLRTRDIAARVGINIATLHYYFATKNDLVAGGRRVPRGAVAACSCPATVRGNRQCA